MLKTYPVFLIGLDRHRAVVLGGGEHAERRVDGLLGCDARVTVVARRITARLRAHRDAGRIRWIARGYRTGDLRGAFLVLVAEGDGPLKAAVWKEAMAERALVSAVDDVEHSSFIAGSVVRRGPLAAAISTGGCAPALAVRLRERLERMLGREYETFLGWMWELRGVMARRHAKFDDRRKMWYRLVDSEILGLLRRGRVRRARRRLEEILGDDELLRQRKRERLAGELRAGAAQPPFDPSPMEPRP